MQTLTLRMKCYISIEPLIFHVLSFHTKLYGVVSDSTEYGGGARADKEDKKGWVIVYTMSSLGL